jgi:hypothetical protein
MRADADPVSGMFLWRGRLEPLDFQAATSLACGWSRNVCRFKKDFYVKKLGIVAVRCSIFTNVPSLISKANILRFYFWALCLLRNHSTIWVMPQTFFALVIFLIGPQSSYLQLLVAGITSMYYYDLPVGWDTVLPTFCPGWPQTMIFQIFTSWVAGITGMHHHAWKTKANIFT